MKGRDILIYLAYKYSGDWKAIYDAIVKKEHISDDDIASISDMTSKAVTIIDEDYPVCLKRCCHSPIVIFYYGDLSLLSASHTRLGCIGSRMSSPYGEEMTKKLVSDLANDYVIVSGLAKGIDVIAHKSAINAGKSTIAVLGSGIDFCYPKSNHDTYKEIKEHHLIISEYPGKTPPKDTNFPNRNRIIASISDGILVTEAYHKSGTLITVGHALSLGKDIFCVPYPANVDSSCNTLIRDGAYLVEKSDDVRGVIRNYR